MLLAVSAACIACSSTTDSLGDSTQPSASLEPLSGPASYPNPFKDLLGKTNAEIDKKLADSFNQLFHGDPLTEAIYAEAGDQAVIVDVFHEDVRTEGFGLAMLIAVQMNRRTEFDRLWRGAQAFRNTSGEYIGFYKSKCDVPSGTIDCMDPYGLQQFAIALIFAHDRWKLEPATIDYGKAARDVLFVLERRLEDRAASTTRQVANSFDDATTLVLHEPKVEAQGFTRPSLVMPAYYHLFGQATADPFFDQATAAARTYLASVAHKDTGLTPVRTDLSGKPLADYDTFQPENYRVQINLTLDQIWAGNDNSAVSNRLLRFFTNQGKDTYGRAFSLDGKTVLDTAHESALVSANGITALIADNSDRYDFVNAVWEQPLATGASRYYGGLFQLLALLALSGQLRVY
ncbi:MAG: glycosyl hydrolase family 8 [Myxococcota bacterium]